MTWYPDPRPLRSFSVEQLARWESSYLDHIRIFFAVGDPDYRTLRTFLDSWYAYRRGDETLIDREGKPIWLNSPKPWKIQFAVGAMHLVTADAREVIKRGTSRDNELRRHWASKDPRVRLVKEHAVPVAEIFRQGKNLAFVNNDDVRAFLSSIYRIALITKKEDSQFGRAEQSSMPTGWTFGNDPFARYKGRLDLQSAEWPAGT